EFNFHVKDIGDVHEKSSIFKDDGYILLIFFRHLSPTYKKTLLRIRFFTQHFTVFLPHGVEHEK
ncbi:hypothetical protein ACQSED_25555, partial [Salmonella enterica]|uniref:hypothetical protein n=1 Tax=Salmonella enterica TaxID=28901 RepID=UPI003D31C022